MKNYNYTQSHSDVNEQNVVSSKKFNRNIFLYIGIVIFVIIFLSIAYVKIVVGDDNSSEITVSKLLNENVKQNGDVVIYRTNLDIGRALDFSDIGKDLVVNAYAYDGVNLTNGTNTITLGDAAKGNLCSFNRSESFNAKILLTTDNSGNNTEHESLCSVIDGDYYDVLHITSSIDYQTFQRIKVYNKTYLCFIEYSFLNDDVTKNIIHCYVTLLEDTAVSSSKNIIFDEPSSKFIVDTDSTDIFSYRIKSSNNVFD